MEDVTGKPFYQCLLEERIPYQIYERVKGIIEKRRKGTPLAYLGFPLSFLGIELIVPKGVFIPRPETEVLVLKVFEFFNNRKKPLFFVDVGTGSGAIALSILKEYPEALCIGVDISFNALLAASENAERLGLRSRFFPVLGDCLSSFGRKGTFDLIISNPPYVGIGEYSLLPREVKEEPKCALLGGRDGFFYLRRILRESRYLLRPGGALVLEMAPHQSKLVQWARLLGYQAQTFKDLDGRNRGILATFREC